MYFLCASIAVYLNGVSVTVTVSAQLRRSQCDASLNGFRLAREVAQVELCIGKQILTTRIRHVVNPIAQAWKRESAQQSWNQLFQSCHLKSSTTKDINHQLFPREGKSRWQQINTNIIEKLTRPSKAADAVHFDADENRIGTLHAAVVGYHLQDVIVILLVVEWLRIADYAYESACNNKINKRTKKSRDYFFFSEDSVFLFT